MAQSVAQVSLAPARAFAISPLACRERDPPHGSGDPVCEKVRGGGCPRTLASEMPLSIAYFTIFVCVRLDFCTRPCVYTLSARGGANGKCARRDGTDSPRRSMEDGPPVAAGETSVGRRRKLNPDGTYRCHSDKQ